MSHSIRTLLLVVFCGLARQLWGDEATVVQKPDWQEGDTWIVQTRTLQLQASSAGVTELKTLQADWKFQVMGRERLGSEPCLRIAVVCLSAKSSEPLVTFWVDEAHGRLRQLHTLLTGHGQQRAVVERYDCDQPAAAVMSPLSAIPLDLPAFVGPEPLPQQSDYRVFGAPVGAKNVGLIGFGQSVRQSARPADETLIRRVLPDALAKSVSRKSWVEISLSDGRRRVQQLWSIGDVWPAYSSNGVTE
ncbi:MAG: hypothetical protein KDA96_22660, partial [Planctomycetaceae bacterium]|nr:hypothetical protein [Planctomycetaceae bacterium]